MVLRGSKVAKPNGSRRNAIKILVTEVEPFGIRPSDRRKKSLDCGVYYLGMQPVFGSDG